METKEKRREPDRQRKAPEERRRRPAGETADMSQRKTQTDASAPRRQRPAGEAPRRSLAQEQRESAHPERTRQRAPEERTAQRKEPSQRPPRREEPARRAAQERPPRRSQETQRPRRQEEVPFSVPKGTGPRKSAPQLNAQQTAELRRQMRSKAGPRKSVEKSNALQDFISGIRSGKDIKGDAAQMAEQRRKERAQRAEKKRQLNQRNNTPAVIYTQPMAFNRDRLLIQLLTVTAVVAALVLGMSVFFKVQTITVSGAETYSAWAIREASGISEGDSLLTFSKARASAKIQASLAYVDDVRIGIKLPDTVIIYIEEMDVSYAIESNQGDWWLINSDGRVVEQITANEASNHTKVLGVVLEDPKVGNDAVAADQVPEETLASGETVPLAVTGAQRLSSVLQILKALEANDIVGQAASVDVSSLEDVTLWYGSRYEVMLGDTANMEYKIACMNDAILELSEYQSGILDISFRTWTDQVGYTPFG